MKQRFCVSFCTLTAFLMLIAVIYGSTISEGIKTDRNSRLVVLQEDNWQLMLKGEWMVEFYAPWCPACKNLATTWARFATNAPINVAKIDVTTSPSLSGRFFVTALPTIYHVKNGEFRQYRGSREGDALLNFIKQRLWEQIEPVSAWKKPDTIHMSILSYFFKLSHTLKDINARLQFEYGLPTWGSYALFAVGTIFVGAALGLILVCIVDFLYPPKKSQRQSFSESKEQSLSGVEDIANDEIEDDGHDNKDDGTEDDDEHGDEDGEANEDEEDDDANEDASTSEGEKLSHSESEEPESEKHSKPATVISTSDPAVKAAEEESSNKIKQSTTKSSPTEVRKRKPRKAD